MLNMRASSAMKNALVNSPASLPCWQSLSILIGISGLASFVAEQRTKEIGVRKVMGASVFNLWGMLKRFCVAGWHLACSGYAISVVCYV